MATFFRDGSDNPAGEDFASPGSIMDKFGSISEIVGILKRRWLLLGLIAGLGMLATALYAISRQSYYETSATILVEGQQISDELARSTVNLSAAARLQMIQQRLMARDEMVATIEKLGLFADAPKLKMATKVDLLRKATRIESISSAGDGGWGRSDALFAFTIAVQLANPDQAAEVVNEFVRKSITQNMALRAERVRDTLAYFDSEDARVGKALADAEAQITAFKKANEDALPENLEASRSTLNRLSDTARDVSDRIADLEEREAELATVLAVGRSGNTEAGLTPEETELSRLQLELAQKRRVLAPTHPEIRRLEQQVAAVTALLAPKPRRSVSTDENLGEERRTATQRQIEQVRQQIEQLRGQLADLTVQRQDIERAIRRTPEVEVSLGALQRGYAELQDQYSDVARRRAEARTGEQLEANNQSERFEVVESALIPDEPVGPNRKKLVVFGSAVSIGLALGLAMALELLNPALRSTAQMESQLNIRPVVAIPYVAVPGERRRRWLIRLAIAAAGLVGLLLAMPFLRQVPAVEALAERILPHAPTDDIDTETEGPAAPAQ